MPVTKLLLSIMIFFTCIANSSANTIEINGNNVKITSDSGKVIGDESIIDNRNANGNNTISIGEIKNNGAKRNSEENTVLEDVVIVNNGKKSVIKKYSSKEKQ